MSIGADGAEYCVKYWSIGAGVSIEYRFHTNAAEKRLITQIHLIALEGVQKEVTTKKGTRGVARRGGLSGTRRRGICQTCTSPTLLQDNCGLRAA